MGGENITWRNIIKIISKAAGKNKFTVPAPVFAVKAVASLFERFSWFPVTKDQLTMLVQGTPVTVKRFSPIMKSRQLLLMRKIYPI